MRRMNSMLSGHQGASARTDCLYRSVASCVAGSSQDSGRCTMRLGRLMRSTLGSSSIAASNQSMTCACDARAASKWICSERMPGVRSSNPASGCAAAVSSSACTWKRNTRSSTGAPNSTSRLFSPARRTQDRGSDSARPSSSSRRRTDCSARGAGCGTLWKRNAVARVAAARSSTARRCTTVTGQTKPPRLGPSGPRITGMSPVKSTLPMA